MLTSSRAKAVKTIYRTCRLQEQQELERQPLPEQEEGRALSFHWRGPQLHWSDFDRLLASTIGRSAKEQEAEEWEAARNVDWIGRRFIVPSYVVVMLFMLIAGPRIY